MSEGQNFEHQNFRIADISYFKIKESSQCKTADITKVNKIENKKLRR